ncbi:Cyclin dependent kinase 2 [Brazilian cedratvirus IHUMI]|uniref:Cyclin dependent kinase 2 n=1 Tax=Brazilian cedratvirus IHUMI TaxID=2126980 RepID=A0A2R8FDB8_9VIRU|nr:Cyclin dependent kinase 2 [Brazilian cedratvirus IHUMI]
MQEERWGSYIVGKVLGKGAYGEVRESLQPPSLAIKRFLSTDQGLDSPGEIAIALQASHPHIIQAREYFTQDNQDYLVMELADTNLQEYLFSTFPSNKERIRLFYQLVSAVTYLQDNGFYHCDIKPLNVLIKDGQIKLGDLGLAKYKNVLGNTCQSFASPQRVSHNYRASGVTVKVDTDLQNIFFEGGDNFADDVWALGITFVFLLTGRILFYEVKTGQQVVDGIQAYIRGPREYLLQNALPERWVNLVLQMLEPSRKLRLPLARDILLQPEFVKRGLQTPLPGYAPVFYHLSLPKSFAPNVQMAARWMKQLMDDENQNSFVLHAAITLFYYMKDFPSPDPKVGSRIKLLACACISLMNSLYSAFSVDLYELLYRAQHTFTREQLFVEERRILEKLKGRLYFVTLPKLALSERAVEKSNTLLLDTGNYLVTNLEEYMKGLAQEETIEERNNRLPVW